jgi:hypothetical protein
MKTDKFEKTIRQKLESISPDFQESDWTKMQGYMQVHTPPSLWQQYGSWLGYAAAASVSTVMAFLYINQLSQNNKLSNDVKTLQTQIAGIKEKPAEVAKVDTVYIIRKEGADRSYGHSYAYKSTEQEEPESTETTETPDKFAENRAGTSFENREVSENPLHPTGENQLHAAGSTTGNGTGNSGLYSAEAIKNSSPAANEKITGKDNYAGREVSAPNTDLTGNRSLSNARSNIKNVDSAPENFSTGANKNALTVLSPPVNSSVSKALGSQFDGIATRTPSGIDYSGERMNTALLNRLSAKQIRKTWMASTATVYKNMPAVKSPEQVTQTQNVIPRLNIKAPYRFGGGMEWQKGVQIKTVVGEVIVAKKFSISAGLSWLKLKQMEFYTEKMFREKNHQDFKQAHPNEVPRAFAVTNIRIAPSLMQIPLTLAFRNDLKDDWAYFVGAGANITVKSNEKISYTCIVPNPREEYLTQSFERKMDISPINSVNFSLGLEKSWHPIVVQAEGYVYSYFKPLTPLNQRTGPGFRVKLLYQIGKKM